MISRAKKWTNQILFRGMEFIVPSRKKLLIFGDSNSFLPDFCNCWPGLLRRKTNGYIYIINDSVSGRTTGFDKNDLNGCFCLKKNLAKYGQVDQVFIMLGTNDVKKYYGPPTPAETKHNLKTMIELILKYLKNTHLAFILPPPIGGGLNDDFHKADERIQPVVEAVQKLCVQEKISVIDTFSILKVDKHLESDKVHLNQYGRQLVADRVYDYLIKNPTV